ncbi:hypothetical protein L210DRAFT_3649400 [Boletus edulis BED1]|uniref:F-box domain-containing protein n=1 Tax=Boletus edulis BED1 TaxID=1328754 RepID=A0AAD4GBK5_BOLED|nr:hypothetical protein L210DRAFT_3649400 [Boletus edulis BED1]
MQISSKTIPTKSAVPLPDEIIFYISHFLNPREVVQLRLVSRQFSSVTRDARLWRALYINSRLPRPPGPFLWQSAHSLERVLSHSTRISQTWTSQPISVVSCVRGPRIPTKPSPVSTPSDFLFGRLFIWCESEQLLAQDLETGVGRLLWESTEPISSLSACSLKLPDAERVFIALRLVDEPISRRTPIKLLEFSLQDDVRLMLGPPTFQMDLPACANFPLSASAHFLYFDGGSDRIFGHLCEPIVIDARTMTIYKFPTFSSHLDTVIHEGLRPWWPGFTLLSGEYIVVFRPWKTPDAAATLIQAFATPDPSAHLSDADIGQLRLTHEVLAKRSYAPTHHIRGAVLDPTTGEITIRFLSADTRGVETRYLCVDIQIPPIISESTDILPMFVNTQELLVLSGHHRAIFLDASNDGHGRGIVTLCTSEPSRPADDPLVLYKFSIDASGEHCTAVVSEPSKLEPEDVLQYATHCIFDGIRGRICHNRGARSRSGFYDLMVLNLN